MNRRERFLLFCLVTIALIGLTFVSIVSLMSSTRELEEEKHALGLELLESEILLEEKDFVLARDRWIQGHAPRFVSHEIAGKELLSMSKRAEKAGLTIENTELFEVSENEFAREAGIRLKLRGSLASTLKWIYEIQQPSLFRAIPELHFVPSKQDPDELITEVVVVRIYGLIREDAP